MMLSSVAKAARNTLQQTHHASFQIGCGHVVIREPDEGNIQLLPFRNSLTERMLVQAIGLAQLTLHTIAVDGMLEVAL